jgi:hypothetical protein
MSRVRGKISGQTLFQMRERYLSAHRLHIEEQDSILHMFRMHRRMEEGMNPLPFSRGNINFQGLNPL